MFVATIGRNVGYVPEADERELHPQGHRACEIKDNWIEVRDAPGLGVTIDEARVRRFVFD